jgi:hypothetical protein
MRRILKKIRKYDPVEDVKGGHPFPCCIDKTANRSIEKPRNTNAIDYEKLGNVLDDVVDGLLGVGAVIVAGAWSVISGAFKWIH